MISASSPLYTTPTTCRIPDDQDRDDYLLQRLPNAEFVMLPTRAPWIEQLVPSFDVEYTYFGQYENPE